MPVDHKTNTAAGILTCALVLGRSIDFHHFISLFLSTIRYFLGADHMTNC